MVSRITNELLRNLYASFGEEDDAAGDAESRHHQKCHLGQPAHSRGQGAFGRSGPLGAGQPHACRSVGPGDAADRPRRVDAAVCPQGSRQGQNRAGRGATENRRRICHPA